MNPVTLIYPQQGGNELTEAKRELPCPRQPHSDVLQQTLRDLDRAFQNWWAGRGRPVLASGAAAAASVCGSSRAAERARLPFAG